MKRRVKRAVWLGGVIVISAAVPILTFLLVGFAQGYYINVFTGEVSRNGLLIVDSQPDSASIYLNGDLKRQTTAQRFFIEEDTYEVRLEREGYIPWQKTIFLQGSGLERLDYPRLFLQDRTTETVLSLPDYDFVSQSPSGRWVVARVLSGDSQTLWRFDARDLTQDPEQLITLSYAAMPGVRWGEESQFILLRSPQLDQALWQVLDIEAAALVQTPGLDAVLAGRAIEQVSFDTADPAFLLVSIESSLQRLGVSDPTNTVLISDKVSSYTSGERGVYFSRIAKDSQEYEIVYWRDGSEAVMQTNLESSITTLESVVFDGVAYVAAYSQEDGITVFYQDSGAQSERLSQIRLALNELESAPNGRYFLLSNGDGKYASYDVKLDRSRRFEVSSGALGAIQWYDGAHMSGIEDGNLRIREFDGANGTTLVDVPDNLASYGFVNDGRELIVVRPGSGLRVELTTISE